MGSRAPVWTSIGARLVDSNFFLKQRTAFIRGFFDGGVGGFAEIQRKVDLAEPPFDNPPFSEDGEPAFLTEWIDAATSAELIGQACISLLSDTLKLYFNTMQKEIGFVFDKREAALAKKTRADQGLVSSSIFEPDLLCSTRLDGSVGAVSISQATLDAVGAALDSVFWTPEQIAALLKAREESQPRR
jgi:hypothetical protein